MTIALRQRHCYPGQVTYMNVNRIPTCNVIITYAQLHAIVLNSYLLIAIDLNRVYLLLNFYNTKFMNQHWQVMD